MRRKRLISTFRCYNLKVERTEKQKGGGATYNYRLIRNIIDFAKENHIRVCCEGVEDTSELSVLERLAPELLQGYLFGKPCDAVQFEKMFLKAMPAMEKICDKKCAPS